MKSIRQLTVLGLFSVLTLTACSERNGIGKVSVKANEAPPSAPFAINVQNQNDDNNFMKYRDYVGVRDEGKATELSNPKPEVSRKLADALTTMEGVGNAHVLVSGDQAFVALTVRGEAGREGEEVSQPLKGAVTDKIRMVEPGIRRVYVTGGLDFVHRFEAIRRDTLDGRSTDGLLRDLSAAVGRLIPTWTVGNNPPPAAP